MSVNPNLTIKTEPVRSADLSTVLTALDAGGDRQRNHDASMAQRQQQHDNATAQAQRAHDDHMQTSRQQHEATESAANRRSGLIKGAAATATGLILSAGAFFGVAQPLINSAVRPDQTANVEASAPKMVDVIMWIDPATGKATIQNSALITTELTGMGMNMTEVGTLLDSMQNHPGQDVSASIQIPNGIKFNYRIIYGADTDGDGKPDGVQELGAETSPKA
ncbi:hypothetical protein IPL44_01015 [Candidatus Saccharibacteria bacterium]|nr:MAG: hypothetical protein IPL44_01015 [Candidatus Saccharibacteria bacterium]